MSETEIRAVLDELAAAHAARDAERIWAVFAPGAVSYTLAPPLQQGPDTAYGTVEGLQKWLAGFAGPVEIGYRDLEVVHAGDVAFVHGLRSMTATPVGSDQPFTLWMRATYGLRRSEDGWTIVHEHESTPFYMDGSFRAAVDLEPV